MKDICVWRWLCCTSCVSSTVGVAVFLNYLKNDKEDFLNKSTKTYNISSTSTAEKLTNDEKSMKIIEDIIQNNTTHYIFPEAPLREDFQSKRAEFTLKNWGWWGIVVSEHFSWNEKTPSKKIIKTPKSIDWENWANVELAYILQHKKNPWENENIWWCIFKNKKNQHLFIKTWNSMSKIIFYSAYPPTVVLDNGNECKHSKKDIYTLNCDSI